jgi:hypothetical protein
MKAITTAILVAALGASSAFAEGPINERQDRQQARIADGVQSGELTRVETARAVRGQVHINRVERRAKADGELTGREFVRIQHKQNQASRQIFRNKHDGRNRD